jgi:hypothetical protein
MNRGVGWSYAQVKEDLMEKAAEEKDSSSSSSLVAAIEMDNTRALYARRREAEGRGVR